MGRTTVTLPPVLEYFLDGAVDNGAFDSKSEGIQQALAAAFKDEYRRVVAAQALYEAGDLSAEEAFRLADVADTELRATLAEELGVDREAIETQDEDVLESIRREFTLDPPDTDDEQPP